MALGLLRRQADDFKGGLRAIDPHRKRWRIGQFLDTCQLPGWNRAGTMELEFRYRQSQTVE